MIFALPQPPPGLGQRPGLPALSPDLQPDVGAALRAGHRFGVEAAVFRIDGIPAGRPDT